MMKLYKLTDENSQTYNNTQWGENVTHETSGEGELCGPGWLHAYTSPELAVLLNPIHGNFKNTLLWECEGIIEKSDHGLKVGTTKLTTIRKIPLPIYTTNQKIAFGILCALEVDKDPKFAEWSYDWLSEKDRTVRAADAVADAADAAAYAAYAADAVADAAYAARAAARAATYAADAAAYAAYAADAAAYAAYAARAAARAATYAADAAAEIDLQSLAKKALTYN